MRLTAEDRHHSSRLRQVAFTRAHMSELPDLLEQKNTRNGCVSVSSTLPVILLKAQPTKNMSQIEQ